MRENRSRGSYEYCCDGEISDFEESWEIVERGVERWIRSMRRVPGRRTVLTVESQHRQGDWVRCDLRWRQTLDGKQTEISASYRFDERGIEVRLQNPIGEMESLRAEPDVVFFPLMRIYSGEVIHRLRRRGAGRVLVPWIGDVGQARRLFRPDYSERRVEAVGEDRICIDGVARNCVEYDYSGGPYPPDTRFWIDENGVLLRYRWQQNDGKRWEVRLRDWRTALAPGPRWFDH